MDAEPTDYRIAQEEDLIALARELNKEGVRYVVAGGWAMNFHGCSRATTDIDLLIARDLANQTRVKKALESLPQKAVRELGDEDFGKWVVVRVVDDILVDVMTKACGVSFEEVEDKIEWHETDEGVRIPFADLNAMLLMKRGPRPKDVEDRGFLRRALQARSAPAAESISSPMTLPSRRVLLVALGLLLILALVLGLPWLSPQRGVERAWRNFITAIEDNDAETLGAYLADNYKDGFGHDREAALRLFGTVRKQFFTCSIRRERPEIVLDPINERAALTRAVIRLAGQGTPIAQAAIQASQASDTPTVFRWRRGSWKPWDWQLVSVENADAARGIARFEREAASLGLTP